MRQHHPATDGISFAAVPKWRIVKHDVLHALVRRPAVTGRSKVGAGGCDAAMPAIQESVRCDCLLLIRQGAGTSLD